MSKVKTSFFCQNCGAQYSKWQGQCNSCKEWNTIVEEIIQKEEANARVSDPFLDEINMQPVQETPVQIEFGDTPEGKNSGFLFPGSWFSGKSKGLFKGINDWMKEGEDFHD